MDVRNDDENIAGDQNYSEPSKNDADQMKKSKIPLAPFRKGDLELLFSAPQQRFPFVKRIDHQVPNLNHFELLLL